MPCNNKCSHIGQEERLRILAYVRRNLQEALEVVEDLGYGNISSRTAMWAAVDAVGDLMDEVEATMAAQRASGSPQSDEGT
jgi:hypothetical protein